MPAPLLPVATNIVDRYKEKPFCINHDWPLPVSSNQKMNEYLAGIKLAHSTLLDWIAKTCTLMLPLYKKLKQELLDSN